MSPRARVRAAVLAIAALGTLCVSGVARAESRCSDGFCIDTIAHDQGVKELRAHHDFAVPAQVELTLELRRMRAEPDDGWLVQVPPGESVPLVRLVPTAPDASYHYRYRYQTGSPHARHDDTARYAIPFGGRAPRMLTQRGNGGFSHRGRIAYDFRMPVGTPILAARAGRVAFVVDDYERGGRRRSLAGKANRIGILHDDGTIGLYVHLQRGAAVAVGDPVVAGQRIGRSGNTGYTTGPHLHFEVYRAEPGIGSVTVPIRFEDASPHGKTPVARSYYGPGEEIEPAATAGAVRPLAP